VIALEPIAVKEQETERVGWKKGKKASYYSGTEEAVQKSMSIRSHSSE
jgi:hypothetical protein